MKKVILPVALFAMLAMGACSTSTKTATDEGDALKAKIENCTDPDSLKIYVKQAQDYAQTLIDKGDAQAAQAYLDAVDPAVKAKDPSLSTKLGDLVEDADSTVRADAKAAVDSAKTAVANAADSVKAVAADKVQAAKDAVADKANDVKDAAAAKAAEAKEAAENAADNAKAKAADALQSGADKLKGSIGK